MASIIAYNGPGRSFPFLQTRKQFWGIGDVRFDVGGDKPGDLYYRGADGNLVALNAPNSNNLVPYLSAENGLPVWKDLNDGGGTADGNNYPTGLGFNIATGLLTIHRSGLSSLTTNLDGRYLMEEQDPVANAKVITLLPGAGISIQGGPQALGSNPVFAISSTITQYTDAMARAAITATPPILYSALTGVISHALSGVSQGTYNNVTVNTHGHVTAGSNIAYLTSLLHAHYVGDAAGVSQFGVGVNELLRFEGAGATTVSFDAATKKVVISSTSGSGADGNNYPTLLSFSSATGVLTLGRNGLGNLTTSLDGRYLQSFTETDPVATAKVITLIPGAGIAIAGGGQTIGSNPTFTIASTITQYTDAMARAAISATAPVLYSPATGVISHASSGVSAGTYNNVTVDAYGHVTAGSVINYLSSLAHSHGIADAAGTQQFAFAVGDDVRFEGSGNTSISFDAATKKVVISSTAGSGADGNNYPTVLSFNSGSGILTLSRSGLADLTTSLDGRYLQAIPTLQQVATAGNTSTIPLLLRVNDSTTVFDALYIGNVGSGENGGRINFNGAADNIAQIQGWYNNANGGTVLFNAWSNAANSLASVAEFQGSGAFKLYTLPSLSAGSYAYLTINTATGIVERVTAPSFTETDPVATAKTITVANVGGILISGSTTQTVGSNPVFGLYLDIPYVRSLFYGYNGVDYDTSTGYFRSTKHVVALDFTGTSTKTLTLTLADGTTVSNTFTDLNTGSGGGVSSVAASIGGALSVAGSPITTSGTLAFSWTGANTQIVRGDGSLGNFFGTLNYLARWTSNNDLGVGVTRDDGTSVGINIAPSSAYLLNVNGLTRTGSLLVNTTTLTNNYAMELTGSAYLHRSGALAGTTQALFASTEYLINTNSFTNGSVYSAATYRADYDIQQAATIPNGAIPAGAFHMIRLYSTAGTANSITLTQEALGGVRAIAAAQYFVQLPQNGSAALVANISHVAGAVFQSLDLFGSNNHTITNYYGLVLNRAREKGANITNSYGIYQTGADDENFFNGRVRITLPVFADDAAAAAGGLAQNTLYRTGAGAVMIKL